MWKGLEVPIPKSLEFASNSGVRIEQLEQQNESSSYVIMGVLILFSSIVIYNAIKNRNVECNLKRQDR